MNAVDLAVMNLKETRRRSIKLWRSLPDEWLPWRPDSEALSFGEMIRHVWEGSYGYHMIVLHDGNESAVLPQPHENEPIVSVEREIELSEPYFATFTSYVEGLTSGELSTRIINRSNIGVIRTLGDMLLRIAYHDSVHTGQFLQYMRTAGLSRPDIWD